MADPVTPEAAKAAILVVDDQPEGLLAVGEVLAPLGQTVVKVGSGREALWHLLRDDFAVVLLDVQMPGMDGFETAALIREREKTRYTPIIFMTAAYRSEDQVFRGYEVGAVDYIFKPVVPEILRSKVAVFVQLAQQRAEIRRQADLLRAADERDHQRQILDALAFSHAVSHDLRAPLRHIRSFIEILSRQYAPLLDEQGRGYLERLSGAAQKLTHLIDAMQSLSAATQGEVRREVVDLSRLAAGLEAELRRGEPERAVDFAIQGNLGAVGDPQLLRLALQNLIENAWKYTRRRARAHIEFGAAERDGAPAFYVRDDGAGFDMAHADRLFSPFSRLHSRTDFEGSGIGLATVQRIILRHGGRVWAEAAVDRGATFYFTLPPPAAAEGGAAAGSA